MSAAAASAAQRAAEEDAVRAAMQAQRAGKSSSSSGPSQKASAAYGGGRLGAGRSPAMLRQNLSGTPSWAVNETHTDNFMLGSPMPPTGGPYIYAGGDRATQALPGAKEWEHSFRSRGLDEETQHLDALRNRLVANLDGVSPQGMVFVIDLVLSQAHEIWQLKRAAKDVDGRVSETQAEAGAEWRNLAHSLAETNQQLEDQTEQLELKAHDSDLWATQHDEFLEEISVEARYVKVEMSEIKRREKLFEARNDKLNNEVEMMSVKNREREELATEIRALKLEKKNAASEIWSMRLADSALRQECSELKNDMLNANEGLAKKMAFDKLTMQDAQRAARDSYGAGAGGGVSAALSSAGGSLGISQRLLDLSGGGSSPPLRDAAGLFEAFASTGGGIGSAPRLRPADFGHLCESLRRAEGRGPSNEYERKGFAEFAFAAVFGNQALEVDKQRFVMLFDHFAQHLQELELAFQHRGESLGRPPGSTPNML